MNQGTPNPYADPLPVSTPAQPFMPAPHHLAVVRQVKLVAILQIVLGVLEILMGSRLVGMGFLMSTAAMAEAVEPSQKDMMIWLQGFYWIFGGLVALVAVVRIVAGILNLWYRGYWLAVITMFAGLVSTFTCYCGPLTVGMCIYGLIILFNPAVVLAFQLARDGKSKQEILAHFSRSGVEA